MVCEPGICSPAGGAFVTIAPADGSPPVTVDGNVAMPGRGLPRDRVGHRMVEITTGYGGGVTMTVGYGSVATPGPLAAPGAPPRGDRAAAGRGRGGPAAGAPPG